MSEELYQAAQSGPVEGKAFDTQDPAKDPVDGNPVATEEAVEATEEAPVEESAPEAVEEAPEAPAEAPVAEAPVEEAPVEATPEEEAPAEVDGEPLAV